MTRVRFSEYETPVLGGKKDDAMKRLIYNTNNPVGEIATVQERIGNNLSLIYQSLISRQNVESDDSAKKVGAAAHVLERFSEMPYAARVLRSMNGEKFSDNDYIDALLEIGKRNTPENKKLAEEIMRGKYALLDSLASFKILDSYSKTKQAIYSAVSAGKYAELSRAIQKKLENGIDNGDYKTTLTAVKDALDELARAKKRHFPASSLRSLVRDAQFLRNADNDYQTGSCDLTKELERIKKYWPNRVDVEFTPQRIDHGIPVGYIEDEPLIRMINVMPEGDKKNIIEDEVNIPEKHAKAVSILSYLY